MPVNPCSIRWYLFKIGDRHYIISRLKDFLHLRPYLKNKPLISFDFDVALQTSLAEFQKYHRLKITNGTLNEETWAAVGKEMSDAQFQQICAGHPTLEYLLCGQVEQVSCPKSTNANCLVNCVVGATEIAGTFSIAQFFLPERQATNGTRRRSRDFTRQHETSRCHHY